MPVPRNGGATAWAAASICSTVVLALGGAFGSSYVRDQSRMEAAIRDMQAQWQQRSVEVGETRQKLANLERDIDDLDISLQREMRILDDRTDTQVAEMDRRLQGEFHAALDDVRDRIASIRAWIEEASANRWTKADQERFEDQLGVKRSTGDQ